MTVFRSVAICKSGARPVASDFVKTLTNTLLRVVLNACSMKQVW